MKNILSAFDHRFTVLLAVFTCAVSCASETIPVFKPSDPAELHFFSFGDWGTGDENQKAVAEAVSQYCADAGCDFSFLLGDNFYDAGVTSVTDPQWRVKFEEVYQGPAMQIPFYAVLGNHDHDGVAQAEIDYSSVQNRWIMPASRFNVRLPEDEPESLVEFFAVDSVYGDALSAETLAELMQSLDASPAIWRVLVLHHPLYSNGRHGDTTALREQLVPVICDRVDVVLSGHDHLFSHLTGPDGTDDGCAFQQFVVGTGGRALYNVTAHAGAVYSEANFGFAAIRILPQEWNLDFIRSDGSHAYHFSLQKP